MVGLFFKLSPYFVFLFGNWRAVCWSQHVALTGSAAPSVVSSGWEKARGCMKSLQIQTLLCHIKH